MAGNVIYRGPVAKEPQTVNLPVNGTLLPGTIVTSDGSQLSQAVAADAAGQIYILSNLRFKDQDVETAYTSGDTGVAYEALPGEVYQARMAAGTYALGDPLTVDANGRLAAAGLDVPIVAHCAEAGTYSAGDLADVTIANRVRSAAA